MCRRRGIDAYDQFGQWGPPPAPVRQSRTFRQLLGLNGALPGLCSSLQTLMASLYGPLPVAGQWPLQTAATGLRARSPVHHAAWLCPTEDSWRLCLSYDRRHLGLGLSDVLGHCCPVSRAPPRFQKCKLQPTNFIQLPRLQHYRRQQQQQLCAQAVSSINLAHAMRTALTLGTAPRLSQRHALIAPHRQGKGPLYYNQVASAGRNYHEMSWDVKWPNRDPHYDTMKTKGAPGVPLCAVP